MDVWWNHFPSKCLESSCGNNHSLFELSIKFAMFLPKIHLKREAFLPPTFVEVRPLLYLIQVWIEKSFEGFGLICLPRKWCERSNIQSQLVEYLGRRWEMVSRKWPDKLNMFLFQKSNKVQGKLNKKNVNEHLSWGEVSFSKQTSCKTDGILLADRSLMRQMLWQQL